MKHNPTRHFSHAWQEFTGVKWQWKKAGKTNSPLDYDAATRAFYIGFCMARKDKLPIREKLKEVQHLKTKLQILEREICRMAKGVRNEGT